VSIAGDNESVELLPETESHRSQGDKGVHILGAIANHRIWRYCDKTRKYRVL